MDQAKLDQMKPIAGSYETLEGSIGVLPLMDSDEEAVPAFVEKYQKNYKEDQARSWFELYRHVCVCGSDEICRQR